MGESFWGLWFLADEKIDRAWAANPMGLWAPASVVFWERRMLFQQCHPVVETGRPFSSLLNEKHWQLMMLKGGDGKPEGDQFLIRGTVLTADKKDPF
jgi:hypothetical protein